LAPENLIAIALGGSVGAGELISRYKDSPGRAVGSLGGMAYIGLNAVASISALALLRLFNVDFGASDTEAEWLQVLAAGFGAMVVLRSSLFIARVGDQDVGVGPSGVLTQFLDAADRAVDRSRAKARSNKAAELVKGLDFAKARAALPLYCLWLLQNPDRAAATALGNQVKQLDQEKIPDAIKTASLAIALMNLVGPDVLKSAIQTLKEDLGASKEEPESDPPPPAGKPAGEPPAEGEDDTPGSPPAAD
jgi:hypothetical protein